MKRQKTIARVLATGVLFIASAGQMVLAQDKIEVIEIENPTEAEKAEVKNLKVPRNCSNIKEMRCIDNDHRWKAAVKEADNRADDDRLKRGKK